MLDSGPGSPRPNWTRRRPTQKTEEVHARKIAGYCLWPLNSSQVVLSPGHSVAQASPRCDSCLSSTHSLYWSECSYAAYPPTDIPDPERCLIISVLLQHSSEPITLPDRVVQCSNLQSLSPIRENVALLAFCKISPYSSISATSPQRSIAGIFSSDSVFINNTSSIFVGMTILVVAGLSSIGLCFLYFFMISSIFLLSESEISSANLRNVSSTV